MIVFDSSGKNCEKKYFRSKRLKSENIIPVLTQENILLLFKQLAAYLK